MQIKLALLFVCCNLYLIEATAHAANYKQVSKMTVKQHKSYAQDLAKRALICQDTTTRHNLWQMAKTQLMLAIHIKRGITN
jgi:hypothetical protein